MNTNERSPIAAEFIPLPRGHFSFGSQECEDAMYDLVATLEKGASEVYIPTNWILSQPDPIATLNTFLSTDKWEACQYVDGLCPRTIHEQAFPTVDPGWCRENYIFELELFLGVRPNGSHGHGISGGEPF